MCFRGLLKRRVRTFLSILGVALSVMLVTGIGITTVNYISILREMNTFYRGRVVVVSRGSILVQTIPIGSVFLENTADEIRRRVEGIKSAIPMLVIIDISGALTFSPLNISIGIPEGNWSVLVGSTPLKSGGRWPQSTNSENIEVLIGGYLAEQNGLQVDSKIKIKNRELTVVGILDSRSAFLSRAIIMPLKVSQELYRYPNMINLIVVEPEEGVSRNDLNNRLELEFPSINALSEEERDSFIEPFFRDIVNWNIGLSSILFAISLVLASSITLMNISERKKEIATLYAVGAPRGFVVRVLALETSLIGFLGGLLGIALGIVAAILLFWFYGNIPVTFMFQHVHELVDPLMILEILAATDVLCFLGGLIPALAIMKKDLTENLRSEY